MKGFKLPHVSLVLLTCTAATLTLHAKAAAGPFQNLDFESAVIGVPVNYELPATQAMPGWTTNNFDSGYIGYDALPLDSVGVSIMDALAPYPGWPRIMYPLQGSYSAWLHNGSGPDGVEVQAWISQTGDIPSTANSLRFTTEQYFDDLTVSLNGIEIPMSLYSSSPEINQNHGAVETFIGDIRQFTGQSNVELCITGDGTLDNIKFSPLVVPEPSTLALIVIGVLSAPLYFLLRPRTLAK